ncbi:hypothetical protein [Streptomyces sp. NPDC096323]|uniref:hypothetical protein n=1 Tax=Streptomyces sp. NPDC096323 TaxID=3155822 RepID=UPI003323CCA5
MTRRTRPNRERRALAARARDERRARLRNLIDRAGRVTLTTQEADALRGLAEAEFAESDALRATVGGQQSAANRHGAQLDAAHAAIREAEQAAAEWKKTAATYSGLYSSAEQDVTNYHERQAAEEHRRRVVAAGTISAACCVCGRGPVTYRNYREQPFCAPCADGQPAPTTTTPEPQP